MLLGAGKNSTKFLQTICSTRPKLVPVICRNVIHPRSTYSAIYLSETVRHFLIIENGREKSPRESPKVGSRTDCINQAGETRRTSACVGRQHLDQLVVLGENSSR